MKRDVHILTSIMELVEICGSHETADPTQVFHIELLNDMGLVNAEIASDGKSAKVKRLTAKGHDALANMHAYVPAKTVGTSLSEEDQEAADKAYAMEVSETRRYEKILYLLASGGIYISLKVIEWCMGCPVSFKGSIITLTAAALLWVITLGTLMLSHACSMSAHEEFIRQIGLGNRLNGWDSPARRYTKLCNNISGGSFMVGAVLMVIAMFIITCTYPYVR